MNKERRLQECSGAVAYVFTTPTNVHVADALLCSQWNRVINYLMSLCPT